MTGQILFVLVFTLTNILQAVTGFAGSMLAMPLGIRLVGIDTSRAVLNAVGILTCIWVLKDHWRSVKRKELLKVSALMLVGILAGQLLFQLWPLDQILKVYGWFIVAIAVKNLVWRKEISLPLAGNLVLLFAAGILHGMFVSGGSLLVIYALEKWKDKTQFRANLSAVWCILNGGLFLLHIYQGFFTKAAAGTALACIAPAFLSAWIGERLQKKIRKEAFYWIANGLLLICGFLLV